MMLVPDLSLLFLSIMQRCVEDWKAEYLYQFLFSSRNEISPAEWPVVLQELVVSLGIGPQHIQEALIEAANERAARG